MCIRDRDSSFELFGKVGLYYIMFLAGLEMNMADFKQKTAYEMESRDWSSDVCSSDLMNYTSMDTLRAILPI